MHLLDDIFYLKSHLQRARKVGVKFKHSFCRLPMHVSACDYWLPPASLLWFMYLTLNLGAGRLWWAFMANDEIKHQSQNDHHHQNQTLCSTQQQISAILEDTGWGGYATRILIWPENIEIGHYRRWNLTPGQVPNRKVFLQIFSQYFRIGWFLSSLRSCKISQPICQFYKNNQ